MSTHQHLWYRLYVANVGDSRAVLCYLDSHQELQATQISDVHNVYNPSEQQRLAKLGLVVDELVHFGRLGPYQVTRSIGDHAIKGGYKDVDILRYSVHVPVCIFVLDGFLRYSELDTVHACIHVHVLHMYK